MKRKKKRRRRKNLKKYWDVVAGTPYFKREPGSVTKPSTNHLDSNLDQLSVQHAFRQNHTLLYSAVGLPHVHSKGALAPHE